jgi:hypothetical protein
MSVKFALQNIKQLRHNSITKGVCNEQLAAKISVSLYFGDGWICHLAFLDFHPGGQHRNWHFCR